MSHPAGDLAHRIKKVEHLVPEQISSSVSPQEEDDVPTQAGLIDQWGRVHPLYENNIVGREPCANGVAVYEGTISRRHARLAFDGAEARWLVEDLGSTNGTYVEDNRIEGPTSIAPDQLVRFGVVGFAFVTDRTSVPALRLSMRLKATIPAQAIRPDVLRIVEPSSGGGAVASFDEKSVQLGEMQFELLALLAKRATEEAARPAEVRGFVPSQDLKSGLPWDTPYPEDNNVKQIVRRTRRALSRLGLDTAIESRQRFGYRLSVPVVLG